MIGDQKENEGSDRDYNESKLSLNESPIGSQRETMFSPNSKNT